jgi:lipopolysaccharide transport system ATP-binding protein
MSDVVVRAAGVAKQFRIGEHTGGSELLSERLARGLRRSGSTKSDREFWALQDIDFEVRQGESFGIIGHNGAGKSTLLKILSRVTPPTRGEIDLYGRVGALLEVGTGFHAELTGRDNIYLNGAILGMGRAEIERKFDEIVDFAEVEQFIDTPVKHYSSGMYLRLAFAVAAHLEPEILIVDEVLAVGDIAFQKKCLGKMEQVAHEGRTVLFVSHDLAAINALCDRTILLQSGSIAQAGPTREVVAQYLEASSRRSRAADRPSDNAEIQLLGVSTSQRGQSVGVINCREAFDVMIEYQILKPVRNSRLFMLLRNERNEIIFGTSDYDQPTPEALERQTGRFTSVVTIPGNIFKVGTIYGTVGADISHDRVIFSDEDAFHVEIIEDGSDIVSGRHQRVGAIAPLLEWKTQPR